VLTFAEMLFKRNEDIEDVISEAVKSGEAVEGDEADDEGLPVDMHCWWRNRLANAGTQPQPSNIGLRKQPAGAADCFH